VFKLSSDTIFAVIISVLLGVVGYFLKETCVSIKGLERDIITIREKMLVIEATRITRADIKEMIAEYHSTHPCKGGTK
jgi:hypothetical protein